MKRVLIVMCTLFMGGAEKSLISMLNTIDIEFLKKNNISIDLLVADTSGVFYKQIPEYINIIKCPYLFSVLASQKKSAIRRSKIKIDVYVLKSLWKFSSVLLKEQLFDMEKYWKANRKLIPKLNREYDVCLAYMNGMTTYYAMDKVNAKKKFIWVHNDYNKLKCTDDFNKEYFEKADGIITISQICVNSLVEHFPKIKEKIQLIENISPFSYIRKRADEFFPDEYVDDKKTRIISIGRLNEQKGFDIGIEAIKILFDNGYKFNWYIIGEGEEKDKLEHMLAKEELKNVVHMLGVKENPYPYIKHADIFFQPSRFEGKSITLDEAKILAKPIVVSNYETVYDSIENGINGLICDLNSKDLADGIARLIDDKELALSFQKTLESSESGNDSEIKKYYSLMLA